MVKTEHKSSNDEINFSEVKEKTKNFFKNIKHRNKDNKNHPNYGTKKDDEINFVTIKDFGQKNSKWLIPLVLILIAIITSTHFRMFPSNLPITDNWAGNTVNNFYRNEITNQINQQYPHLPAQNRDALVNQEFQKFIEENEGRMEQEKAQLSQQYKANFKDENGDTYLLAIDPYLWYSQARNIINYGHLGDKIIDGKPYFSLRDGRLDKKSSIQFHPYIAAYLYRFLHLFNKNITLMRALFLLPAILIALSLIPAFLIGRRISGNVGGFFTAMFLAVNVPLLGRTPAGFADTDAYSILIPLLIVWLFFEAYAAKKNYLTWLFAGLSGLFVGVYAVTWTGWPTTFLFVLGSILIVMGLKIITCLVKNKYKFNSKLLLTNHFKKITFCLVSFFLSSAIFVSLFKGTSSFWNGFIKPIKFMTLKSVGIKSIWPNVLTTVAEFNTISFSKIMVQMGGKLLFFLALIGIILMLIKKNKKGKRDFLYAFLILIWFASTAYAFTKGVRFAILIVPPFTIALGSALGFGYETFSQWISKGIGLDKKISKLLILIVFSILLITPFTDAKIIANNEIPSMNDAWYNSLTKIKQDTTDSIITSWWDFGHWFVAVAERRVTFDGGDQGERIHWVGKTLITDSEAESVGILRMLNCAQETAPHKLDEFTRNSLKSIQMLYQIFPISNKDKAKQKYIELGLTTEQAEVMLNYTHCQDLLPNYYITSEDMVGKAGVWGHFGSWDFEKATMYQNTKKISRPKAIAYLTKNFAMTEESADQIHQQIQTIDGDRWISPWPGYLSGFNECGVISENMIECHGSVQGNKFTLNININNFEMEVIGNPGVAPNSIVYVTKDGVEEKKTEGKQTAGFSVILAPRGDSYKFMIADPLQASGIFTRLFFLGGHGLKCFSKFDEVQQITGEKIIIWKVDYTCQQENNVFQTVK